MTYLSSLQQSVQRAVCDGRRKTPVSLQDQIQAYIGTLTDAQKNRPWSIDELIPHLDGVYRDRPASRKVAQALRAGGWKQKRDWTVKALCPQHIKNLAQLHSRIQLAA